jgi:hypothetical protein
VEQGKGPGGKEGEGKRSAEGKKNCPEKEPKTQLMRAAPTLYVEP